MGGGGITGAAYEMATLMAIELATGWSCNSADVVVGTSSGAFVTALVRSNRLDLDSLVLPTDEKEQVAARIRERIYRSNPGVQLGKWVRHGILPGVRRPGLTFLLGSPAPYDTSGLGDSGSRGTRVGGRILAKEGNRGCRPRRHRRRRTAFGTLSAPDIGLADAVAASSAIPLVFRPYFHLGRPYVDGGVASGTHADLVLGNHRPLDLVLVVAPMAAEEDRRGALPHERLFDRVGRRSLTEEVGLIRKQWPECEVLILRPTPQVLVDMRPNPMDPDLAVPAFIRTLIGMKRQLARPENWSVLKRHLGSRKRVRQPT